MNPATCHSGVDVDNVSIVAKISFPILKMAFAISGLHSIPSSRLQWLITGYYWADTEVTKTK